MTPLRIGAHSATQHCRSSQAGPVRHRICGTMPTRGTASSGDSGVVASAWHNHVTRVQLLAAYTARARGRRLACPGIGDVFAAARSEQASRAAARERLSASSSEDEFEGELAAAAAAAATLAHAAGAANPRAGTANGAAGSGGGAGAGAGASVDGGVALGVVLGGHGSAWVDGCGQTPPPGLGADIINAADGGGARGTAAAAEEGDEPASSWGHGHVFVTGPAPGASEPEVGALVDRAGRFLAGARAARALWWCATPLPSHPWLPAALLARGWRDSWEPVWMWREVSASSTKEGVAGARAVPGTSAMADIGTGSAGSSSGAGAGTVAGAGTGSGSSGGDGGNTGGRLRLTPALHEASAASGADRDTWQRHAHPYHGGSAAARAQAATATQLASTTERVVEVVAWKGSEPVGTCTLVLSDDDGGGGAATVAGMYDMGTLEAHRRKGVGRAVVEHACRVAAARGCRLLVLNAAAPGFYEACGFKHAGKGCTWFHPSPSQPPVPPRVVALAEAVARNDVPALDALLPSLEEGDVACGNKRLLRLAARFRCVAAGKWLVRHGATLDFAALWKLGLHDAVRDALTANPAAARELDAESGASPLHDAVAAGNTELLLVLMEAVPPAVLRELQDATFHATPLQWARFNRQVEAATAIEARLELTLSASTSDADADTDAAADTDGTGAAGSRPSTSNSSPDIDVEGGSPPAAAAAAPAATSTAPST